MGGRRGVGLGWAAGSGECRGWDVAWAWIRGRSINNGVGWVGVSCEGPGVGVWSNGVVSIGWICWIGGRWSGVVVQLVLSMDD